MITLTKKTLHKLEKKYRNKERIPLRIYLRAG
ncbi:MAG: adhesin [Deltaproteobacteria bacterium]|nr:adhesin [Deltaproteobacteria bacterium]